MTSFMMSGEFTRQNLLAKIYSPKFSCSICDGLSRNCYTLTQIWTLVQLFHTNDAPIMPKIFSSDDSRFTRRNYPPIAFVDLTAAQRGEERVYAYCPPAHALGAFGLTKPGPCWEWRHVTTVVRRAVEKRDDPQSARPPDHSL